MPRERTELLRKSSIKTKGKIIVLAFEGNITESKYFEALKVHDRFNNDLIYLHLLTRAKNDNKSDPKHVFDKLKKEAKDEYNFDKGDELWMIIDKDRWRNIPEIITLCREQKNMFVAVTNPCFEFWLLLHIKNYSNITTEEKALLVENKKVSNHKNYIDRYLKDSLVIYAQENKLTPTLFSSYKKKSPKPNRFFEGLDLAIEQAKKLDSSNSTLKSDVYKIVDQLIK